MIIDCIADLHGFKPPLKGGDLLIIAGDITAHDTLGEYCDFADWVCKQDYRHKIFVPGNHDNAFIDRDTGIGDAELLKDSGTEFDGIKIWGSPWTLKFKGVNPKCKAFMTTESKLEKKWELIPNDIDILITHGPAFGLLDGIPLDDGTLYHAGSISLHEWLIDANRPALHVFGHIHEAAGIKKTFPHPPDKCMISVNCSYVDGNYNQRGDVYRIQI